MSESPKLAHPELYGADARLHGVRCADCGRVAFPRQHYGCEVCGGTRSEDVELDAHGTLRSFATVHLHQSKSIAAPFVIGEIELDAGPTLRLTLVEPDDHGLRIGAPMRGVLHPAPGGEGALELRFTREAAR
jgi:uncharacterized OB-fold protein